MAISGSRKRKPARGKPTQSRTKPRQPKTSPTLDWIIALSKNIPQEEQARHPEDGASNLHHYLHGAPKQD
jgi:hypothetical protein